MLSNCVQYLCLVSLFSTFAYQFYEYALPLYNYVQYLRLVIICIYIDVL